MVPQFADLAPGVRLVEHLRQVGQRLTRCANERMLHGGTSYARARLLACLARDGPMRSIDLAQHFNQAPRTITEAIDGLQRDGFVTREVDREDRRVKRILITETGMAALGHSYAAATQFGHEIETLLGADLPMLDALLDRIEQSLDGPADKPRAKAA